MGTDVNGELLAMLAAADFFRYAPHLRETIQREVEAGSLMEFEELRRFSHADAEDVAEHGMALALARALPLLRARGIESYVLGSGPRLYEVYIDLPGQGFVTIEEEWNGWYADGTPCEYDEGVARVGSKRFSAKMDEYNGVWRFASRALCYALNWILEVHGCTERAYSILPNENDHAVLLGTPEMARILSSTREFGPVETWPELERGEPLHEFVCPDPEIIANDGDLEDADRLQIEPTETLATLHAGMSPTSSWRPRHNPNFVFVGNLPSTKDELIRRIGFGGFPWIRPRHEKNEPIPGAVVISTGSREASANLVRALHNREFEGRRLVAQAAPANVAFTGG